MKIMKTKMYKLRAVLIITLTNLLISSSIFAQAPQKMSYQAVVRNGSGELVQSHAVGIKISILQTASTGTPVYVETHTATTNANGLVTIEIGGGTPVTGTFAAIDWSAGPFFLKTETDLGGANPVITGTSQLLSVPYALHTKTAKTITGTVTETDPVYSASQAANITATDITNLSNLSGINTGDQDVSSFITSETDPVYSASQAAAMGQKHIKYQNYRDE
jgi:hypothetical protein